MVTTTGYYRDRRVELDQPVDLPDGTPVEVQISPIADSDRAERTRWAQLGMDRLEEEWDTPQDAVYDDWKKLYGVSGG
jgi:hypothetical protein